MYYFQLALKSCNLFMASPVNIMLPSNFQHYLWGSFTGIFLIGIFKDLAFNFIDWLCHFLFINSCFCFIISSSKLLLWMSIRLNIIILWYKSLKVQSPRVFLLFCFSCFSFYQITPCHMICMNPICYSLTHVF